MKQTRIVNLDRLNRKLSAMPKAVRAELRKALAKGGDDWVKAARPLTPEGDSGDLRASHRHRQGDHELQEKLITGDDKAFHAHFQEFGTIHHSAQPSHVPAFRLVKARVKGRIKRATKKAAKDVAAGRVR